MNEATQSESERDTGSETLKEQKELLTGCDPDICDANFSAES